MRGTVFIRPIEAKLFRDVELFKKMDPYCLVTVGDHTVKGTICYKGGKTPKWDDIMIFRTTREPVCVLELMDKDTLTSDDIIGVCEIDLQEVEDEGRVAKWYELHYKRKLAGEILIEATFSTEQCPQEPIVYSGKKVVKREITRGHPGNKAAARHIIAYKEKKLRPEKGTF
jgi:Ca2+-dependent lipid-binding protein